jgi:hypothetical protein
VGQQGTNAPGTRNLIAELLQLRRERLNALCEQALDVIDHVIKARKFLVVW